MMDRRGFFRSLAKGVLATAAALYAPRVLAPLVPPKPKTSVWLVRWGEDTPPTVEPAPATFNGVPLTTEDPLWHPDHVYRDKFVWDFAPGVEQARAAVRGANLGSRALLELET